MSDYISRQATLKHIENIRQGVQMMDDIHRASIIMNGMHLCEEAVRNQPSAEPEQQIPQMRGWVCPVCGRVLSPYTSVCPCNNGKGWEITC